MYKSVISIILIFSFSVLAQEIKSAFADKYEFANSIERQNLLKELLKKIDNSANISRFDDTNEQLIKESFWAAQLLLKSDTSLLKTVKKILLNSTVFQNDLLRSAIEIAYTLFPTQCMNEIHYLLSTTLQPKIFAMSAIYLLRTSSSDSTIVREELKRIKSLEDHPIITMLKNDIATGYFSLNPTIKPPIADLLTHQIEAQKFTMYSLQRKNRNFPGLLLIKDEKGNFLKNDDGSLFYIPQLARSISNIRGYITNGNTPQGIFSIQGVYNSLNKFIGPTPAIELLLPFEAPYNVFIHQEPYNPLINDNLEKSFNIEDYTSMLPNSWRNYVSIFEAFFAGKAGRNQIMSHGTTVDPTYYTNEIYYPNTPTQGCLCAIELWDSEGNLKVSFQKKLIEKLNTLLNIKGYLVVVEVGDENQPVSIEEIKSYFFK